jgi:group I intron endonuclease
MAIYSIYKITNIIDGKCYVGCTKDWEIRKKQHEKSTNYRLSLAINKFGPENFTWEVIYQSKDKSYCFNIMEPHFIKEYDCVENGYNKSPGGLNLKDRPFILTEEMFSKLDSMMKL